MIVTRKIFVVTVLLGFVWTVVWLKFQCSSPEDTQDPIIFVGGFPRSGTTLMRVILDSHPQIRCGQETHVIPKLLLHVGQYNLREKNRLDAAGVTEKVLDSAVASFILQIIKGHGTLAGRFCNKDPLALRNMTYLAKLFPNSKFILMIRDGRAVVHSLISRRIIIRGIQTQRYDDLLKTWDKTVSDMVNQCAFLGPRQCLFVSYEHLVLFPTWSIKYVLQFADVQWDDKVLHHERYIGTPMGPVVSRLEKSSDQVVQAIYLRSLYTWVEALPIKVKNSIDVLAPILTKLGYDTKSDRPNYSKVNVQSLYK